MQALQDSAEISSIWSFPTPRRRRTSSDLFAGKALSRFRLIGRNTCV